MEESPEEVLARLERYVESVRGRPPQPPFALPAPGRPGARFSGVTPPPAPAPSAASSAVDTLIPARTEAPRRRQRLLVEVAPALFAVSSCTLLIVAFEWLDSRVATVVAGALLLVGVVGLFRRVPFARAWTIGLVVAAVLIRTS